MSEGIDERMSASQVVARALDGRSRMHLGRLAQQ